VSRAGNPHSFFTPICVHAVQPGPATFPQAHHLTETSQHLFAEHQTLRLRPVRQEPVDISSQDTPQETRVNHPVSRTLDPNNGDEQLQARHESDLFRHILEMDMGPSILAHLASVELSLMLIEAKV